MGSSSYSRKQTAHLETPVVLALPSSDALKLVASDIPRTAHQPQGETAMSLDQSVSCLLKLLEAVRAAQRPHCHASHERYLNQTALTSSSTGTAVVSSLAYSYFRLLKRFCKALIMAAILWIFLMGQPDKLLSLPQGLYQGFVHGWDSRCADWWTCHQ